MKLEVDINDFIRLAEELGQPFNIEYTEWKLLNVSIGEIKISCLSNIPNGQDYLYLAKLCYSKYYKDNK